jgi:hypothetical protein
LSEWAAFFCRNGNWNPDVAVALLWTAGGFGLFAGMMIARRVAGILDAQ